MEKHDLQQRITVPLAALFLDPNNYRFINSPEYSPVPDDRITDEKTQRKTALLLVGEKNGEIADLLKSFKTLGFLEVDQIQVEEIGDATYRVLEGNRRVATLKKLQADYARGADVENLDPTIFDYLPVTLVRQQKAGEHEMIMALKHISGNKKWPTLNQAQLLHDLVNKYGWTEEKVVSTIPDLTLHKLRRDLRTLSLISSYKKSDYGDQFETDLFNLFREVVSSTDIKAWIGWDEGSYQPTNNANMERLFSWLSKIDVEDEEGEIVFKKERILKQGDDVRALASIIHDATALDFMEQERSITKAYSISTVVANDRYKNILKIIEQQVAEAKVLSSHADQKDKEKIFGIKQELDGILVSVGEIGRLSVKNTGAQILYKHRNNHLSALQLRGYKQFKADKPIQPFNQVNIIAGSNNAGKTSLLEAVYLLCHLNDYEGLYEMLKRRGKFLQGLPAEWMERVIPAAFSISGVFDDYPCSVAFTKDQEADEKINKSDYLTTVDIHATFRENEYKTKLRIKSGSGKFESFFKETFRLCKVVMSNPFTMMDRTLLEYYHNIALERGAKNEIMTFIQQEVDENIIDIEKGGTGEDFRFLVTYSGTERPIDLTEFGDGVQRIYQISLMMVAAENGVICIDEIENAIHHSLLVKFTGFIQRIANKYNVQIFASTHSNECIGAFFENGYKNEQITGFQLEKKPDGVAYKKVIGEKFQIQMEQFSLDLRG